MPLSTEPWDGAAAQYDSAAAYCNASLHNGNTGPASGWTKQNCALPVYEPDGSLNRNGMAAAAAALTGGRGGVALSAEDRRKAAVKLIGLYRANSLDPPAALAQLAHSSMNYAIRSHVSR